MLRHAIVWCRNRALTTGTLICSRLGRIAIVGVRDVSTWVALQARSAVATCDFGRLLAAQGSDLLAARTRILWTGERSMSGGNGQALVIPALSLSMTWLIVKLAGRCDGGNSINDWAIWATWVWAGINVHARSSIQSK